ncbi:low molecular weight protein-tyrosine-phosphatase [Ornithinicoccus halotolerans]|uniref:low molecular weight protein-tyrosine-phosphatase n=1 Tax=Ornithinicoccus halotolerans TaxID=1748220 RepID=UPI001297C52F|nr:low molecular weight protein-tyrosine-phosphatase [Ornithinicoccus halotolerans]
MRVCFVCLGNICRSPAAKAVLTHLADRAGVEVAVDAAGTSRYHLGEPPHDLAAAEAERRGVLLEHEGQQFTAADFERFDLVVAMDEANELDVLELAPDESARRKVVRLGAFADDASAEDPETVRDVTDPWGHGPEAFTAMYDHLEETVGSLLRHLQQGTAHEVAARHRAVGG